MRASNFFASAIFVSLVSLASQAQTPVKLAVEPGARVVTPTGIINVYTSPFAAPFWLVGPASYSGETIYTFSFAGPVWLWWKSDCPIGTYTIIYGAVPGYITPPSQTFVLSAGNVISFSGSYESYGFRSASPSALSFTYQMGQALPQPQVVSVVTPGGSQQFTAYPYGNVPWLSVTPAFAKTPTSLLVTVHPEALSEGTYQALIMISFDQNYQPLGVPVTLVVLATPQLQVTPTSLSFSYQAGGSPPDGQKLYISSLYKNVNVSVSSSVGWLNASASGTTPLSATAWVEPNGLGAGTYYANITIMGSSAANSPMTVPVTLVVAPAPAPPANMAVVNGASMDRMVAPCSIATIFGTNLAQKQAAASTSPLPFTLGGASIKVNGKSVPLFFASPGQLNFQIHCNINSGLFQVEVNNGIASGWTTVQVAPAAPGLFLWQDRWIAAQNQDGTVHGEYNPAKPDSVVTVYFTGQGLLDHAISMNQPAPMDQLMRPLIKPTVTINGQEAELLFAGLTPGSIGLAQLNVRVPDLPPGEYPMVVTMNGVSSNSAIVCIGEEY